MLDSDPIQVIARCQSNKTEVYISWHDFLGDDTPTDVYSEQKRVTYRFPPADATTELWGISTDNVATFVAQPIPFLRTLVASDQLSTSLDNRDAGPLYFSSRPLRASFSQNRTLRQ